MKGILTVAGVLAVVLVGALYYSQRLEQTDGLYETARTQRGAGVYAAHCASCHGAGLQGASASGLEGPATLVRWVGQNGHDLYQRVRTMPYGMPGSLGDQEYIDAVAFLLARNGNPAAESELSADQSALQEIQLATAADLPEDARPPQHRLPTVRDVSAAIGEGPTQAELTAAGSKTTDWLFTNHDYEGQRYVDLRQITRANVSRLRPVCLYQVGDLNPFEVNPLIYRGNMFITSATPPGPWTPRRAE